MFNICSICTRQRAVCNHCKLLHCCMGLCVVTLSNLTCNLWPRLAESASLLPCRGVGPRALSNGINSAVFFCFFEALRGAFKRRQAEVRALEAMLCVSHTFLHSLYPATPGHSYENVLVKSYLGIWRHWRFSQYLCFQVSQWACAVKLLMMHLFWLCAAPRVSQQ